MDQVSSPEGEEKDKEGEAEANPHPSLFDIYQELGHAGNKESQRHRSHDELGAGDQPCFLEIKKSGGAIVPPEESEEKTDGRFIGQSQQSNRILYPFNKNIEKPGDLAEPNEETGQKKHREDFFKVPVHPAVSLHKDV
jgi:hypothetical protein